MKVIPPITLTELNITSSTISEPTTATAYNSGTTYALNDTASILGSVYQSLSAGNIGNDPSLSPLYWQRISFQEVAWNSGTTYAASTTTAPVYVLYKHRIYQSLLSSNTNQNPLLVPTYWQDIGPSNTYAMFDTQRGTASFGASPLTVVLTPNQRANAIALLNVIADTVRVVMTVAGVTVYDSGVVTLVTRNIIDCYTYVNYPFIIQNNTVLFNLPANATAVTTVTLTRTTGSVFLGALAMGLAINLGAAQYDAVDSQLNFSTITNDNFGHSVLVPRIAVATPTITTWLPSNQVAAALQTRASLNAVPAVWVGVEDNTNDYFFPLLILGVYTQFDIALKHTDTAELNLTLKETG